MVRLFMDKKFYVGDKVIHKATLEEKGWLGEVVNVIPGDRDCPTFYEVMVDLDDPRHKDNTILRVKGRRYFRFNGVTADTLTLQK